MIKTTSFALPRSQSPSHPASKTVARQKAIKAAKAREASQPAPNPFASATAVPEISAAQARDLIQSSAPQTKKRTTVASIVPSFATPQPQLAPQITAPVPAMPTSTAPKAAKTRTPKPKTAAAPVLAPAPSPQVPAPEPVEVAPAPVVVAPVAVALTPEKAATTTKRAKRARVPANLAEQYGQNISKRVENGIEDVPIEDGAPKKRLSRTERQARRELMNLDDDLMARLQRAHNAIPSAKPVKKQRGWRFDCGRCGQTSYFQTNGALCNCGALAIKE